MATGLNILVGRGTTSFPQVYLQLYTVVTFCVQLFLYTLRTIITTLTLLRLCLCAINLHDIVYCVISHKIGTCTAMTHTYCDRYNTLPEEEKHEFGLEEDNLLSIILHDLLVFMLMVGLSREETTMLIHRFAARIRLATSEEKLLQQTLKYIEQKV